MTKHPSPAVQEMGEAVAEHMTAILSWFKPGAKITVLVRRPEAPDHSQDFVQTNDTLEDAITALERRRNSDQTIEGKV